MIIKYKEYQGIVEYDSDDKIFVGSVKIGKDMVIFQGKNGKEIEKDLAESMEEYFLICKEQNKPIPPPFSGKFVIRLKPETHAKLSLQAHEKGVSLNQLCEKVLSK